MESASSDSMVVTGDGDNNAIDEGLYSRQLYVMGHEAQKRMASSDVLIIGLSGLGVEVAKNLILAGVKSVTLYDPSPVTFYDLSAQFYLTEADVGKPRAAASLHKLAELNQYVLVSDAQGPLDEAFITRFQVIAALDLPLSEQLRLNALSHKHNLRFISSELHGLFGSVFCDFGTNFVVFDASDLPASSCMVASITNTNPATVTVLEDSRHGLESGDVVALSDVEGMTELNGREFRVRVTGPYTFEIDVDASVLSPYSRSGYINQVKQPVTHSFQPLQSSLSDPGDFVLADFAKMERPGLLHLAFQALHLFMAQHNGQPPISGNGAHADEVLSLAKELNAKSTGFKVEGEVLERGGEVVRQLALGARGQLCPMAALFGGIVGQEVLKACSGKFTPIKQWFYFDALECLPTDGPLGEEEVAPRNCRYDGQIAVFGKGMQTLLANQAFFLVGAGAIGCEMLKNWALMGLGSGEQGAIHVTDMDRIEKSNLSRQFLFRPNDIGAAKSVVAARAAGQMNSALKVCAYESRVGGDTEVTFNDDFYDKLTGVCTALDNVDARLYMDQRCLFYKLPMLESGTLGTKGNTQVVVPHLTENYGATRDPPEKSIPVCTLKNFPNQIEHTLQWARDWFEGAFKQAPEDANQYLTNPTFLDHLKTQQNTKLETLKRIHDSLVQHRPSSFEDCVTWARLRFDELFNHIIRQLLHNFPVDQVTSTGAAFWSGAKKPPSALVFDVEDPLHLGFVRAVARLRAYNYGIAPIEDDAFYRTFLPEVMVPDFQPQDGVKIAETDAEAKAQAEGGGSSSMGGSSLDVDSQAENLIASLPAPSSLPTLKLVALDFDKDLDDHMHVVAAASNLRARNYKIPEADLHRSRQIAGKIIPAIATTTALVTGLVCLELYKVVQKKPLDSLKNAFVNLALPLFTFSEPQPPAHQTAVVKGEEWKWSAWDRIEIEGDLTLREFLKYMEDQYGLSVSMLSHGVSILYSFFASKRTVEQRMPMKLSEVVGAVTKKALPDSKKFLILEIIVSDKDTGEEKEVPFVRVRIK